MRMKRKSLIEERYYGIKKRQMNFIKMVQERAVKMKTSWVPFLPNDLMFKVFLLLPIKSLLRFTSVCKAWYKLIHCAEFVEAYNNHAETTPIILRGVASKRPSTFHVETQLNQAESFCLFPCSSGAKQSKFIHFLEIDNEKGKLIDLNISCSGSLVSTCNGLILITSMQEGLMKHSNSFLDHPLVGSQEKPGWLIVMNPMTRKLIGFPPGTLPIKLHNESYGLVYSHLEGVFKVVHLFKDKSGCIACEILSLQTRSWKAVDGPVGTLFNKLGQAHISALGALHWLPGPSNSNYIISMGADDEKFSVTDLPMTMGMYNRLVEMGGFLSFVNSLDMDHIDVWVLKGLEGAKWVKQHTICIDALLGYVDNEEYSLPSFGLNAKEMVFRRKKRLYAYDFELEEIREIEMDHESITAYENIIPHSNNLATWEPLEPMR
uniref:F-box domain-containing protein n=1 Tax=Chenopodium quinoa TaxID=63459 RepID=A0A803KZX3_CHEQI